MRIERTRINGTRVRIIFSRKEMDGILFTTVGGEIDRVRDVKSREFQRVLTACRLRAYSIDSDLPPSSAFSIGFSKSHEITGAVFEYFIDESQ